jgi:hypothetical protein
VEERTSIAPEYKTGLQYVFHELGYHRGYFHCISVIVHFLSTNVVENLQNKMLVVMLVMY